MSLAADHQSAPKGNVDEKEGCTYSGFVVTLAEHRLSVSHYLVELLSCNPYSVSKTGPEGSG